MVLSLLSSLGIHSQAMLDDMVTRPFPKPSQFDFAHLNDSVIRCFSVRRKSFGDFSNVLRIH